MKLAIILIFILYTLLISQVNCQVQDRIDDEFLNETNQIIEAGQKTKVFSVDLPARNSSNPNHNHFTLVVEIVFKRLQKFGQERFFIEVFEGIPEVQYDVEEQYGNPDYSENRYNNYNEVWYQKKTSTFTKKYTELSEQKTFKVAIHNEDYQQSNQQDMEFDILVYTNNALICPHNCGSGTCLRQGCECNQNFYEADCQLNASKLVENLNEKVILQPKQWKFYYWTIKSPDNSNDADIELKSNKNLKYAYFMYEFNNAAEQIDRYYIDDSTNSKKIQYNIENKQGKELFFAIYNPSQSQSQNYEIMISYEEKDTKKSLIIVLLVVFIILGLVISGVISYLCYKKHVQRQELNKEMEMKRNANNLQREQTQINNVQRFQTQQIQQHQPQQERPVINNNNRNVPAQEFNLGRQQQELPLQQIPVQNNNNNNNQRYNYQYPEQSMEIQPVKQQQDQQIKIEDVNLEKNFAIKENENKEINYSQYKHKLDQIYQEKIESTNICSICCENYEGHDKLQQLKCGHLFHSDCIQTWFDKSKFCPLCNQKVVD